VGTRAYTPYGKQACDHLISGLKGAPVVIVSGLALGIDAIAHKAALNAGLPTVAFPGSGLDWSVMYPRTNSSLARAIVNEGGALVSEYEPTFKAVPWSFLQRNHLMAAVSHATLLIEATERSGTLVTAKLATDYNRDVLAVPGSIFSGTSKGTHLYIRLGATPITNAAEILDALGIAPLLPLPVENRPDVGPEERHVLTLLAAPIARDELIQRLAIPVTAANILLSTMELKGLITEELGVVRKT
jgi:DNA processing protein